MGDVLICLDGQDGQDMIKSSTCLKCWEIRNINGWYHLECCGSMEEPLGNWDEGKRNRAGTFCQRCHHFRHRRLQHCPIGHWKSRGYKDDSNIQIFGRDILSSLSSFSSSALSSLTKITQKSTQRCASLTWSLDSLDLLDSLDSLDSLDLLESHQITSHHIKSNHLNHIKSHHIKSHHDTSHQITENLKRWITDLVTTSNQEMLAHLKTKFPQISRRSI